MPNSIRFSLLACFCIFLLSCGDKQRHDSPVYSDLGNLPKLIHLPKSPVSVKWMSKGVSDNDWILMAVMQFEPDDLKLILKDRLLGEPAEYAIATSEYEQLFPADITVSKKPKEILLQARVIEKNPFVDINKGPLIHGDAFLLSGGWIYLNLYTM